MEPLRPADTFVIRVRREPQAGDSQPPVERWQVEHVQTGLRVYVHDLDEAVGTVRTCLANLRDSGRRRPRR